MSSAAGGEQSLEDWWHGVVSGQRRGLGARLARGGLAGLAGLYWLGLQGNLALYRWGLKTQTRPPMPVISVGNLTLGGTGKTTTVRYLARRLAERGLRPGIVLRGHRGKTGGAAVVANDGAGCGLAADVSGDEAAEYGRLLPEVPVAVGKRREQGLRLLADLGVQVGLLDDGFQYFRMARTAEVVLLSARTAPEVCGLFPRGVLREPWAHLARASQVWLTHTDQASPAQVDAWRGLVSRCAPAAAVLLTRHAPRELVAFEGGPAIPVERLGGTRVVAVSGLGDPLSFERVLADCGAEVVPCRFPDHHAYRPEDWQRAADLARDLGAQWLVTTEKDAVKVQNTPPWPTLVLHSELAVVAGEDHVDDLLAKVTVALGQ